MGRSGLKEYLQKYDLELDGYYRKVEMNYSRRQWSKFINESNEHLCSEEAIDLLDRMLKYDKVNTQ